MGCKHGYNKHGSRHPIYSAWAHLKERCLNKNVKNYQRYGGRGIKVCERWMKFENFLEDMGSTWQQGLTIERKNSNGNYSLDNCIWADRIRQARNRYTTKMNSEAIKVIKFSVKNNIKTQAELARIYKVKRNTINAIIKNKNWKDIKIEEKNEYNNS